MRNCAATCPLGATQNNVIRRQHVGLMRENACLESNVKQKKNAPVDRRTVFVCIFDHIYSISQYVLPCAHLLQCRLVRVCVFPHLNYKLIVSSMNKITTTWHIDATCAYKRNALMFYDASWMHTYWVCNTIKHIYDKIKFNRVQLQRQNNNNNNMNKIHLTRRPQILWIW